MEGKYPALTRVVMSKGYASIDQEEKIRIQDEIGQAVLSDVVAWGRALPDDQRRLFIWAVFTCMGYEVAVAIAKETVLRPILEDDEATLLNTHKDAMNRVREKRQALEAREQVVEEREQVVKAAQEELAIKERQYERQNAVLVREIKFETSRRCEVEQLLATRTAELEIMQQEIARLRKIEDAVKLLKSL